MTKKRFQNNFLYLFLAFITLSLCIFLISGCANDDEDDDTDLIGNWFELSDFEGVPRSDAVAIVIGEKAYVGTGYDGSDRLNDFWEYDPDRNSWAQKADFPGVPRNGAVGFGTETKGYIGTGYDGVNKLQDLYEYDPSNDTWIKIADFGGTARYGAVAFAIGNTGYVGTGYNGNMLKDLWEYDPDSGQWIQRLGLGGGKRRDAVAFVIDGKGYICTGTDNGSYEDDLWEYDPLTDEWSRKRFITNMSDDDYDDDYSGIIGMNKVAFSVNGKGYVATGGAGSAGTAVWAYDPVSDLWEQKTSLEASARIEAVCFAVGDRGYLLTGRSGSYYFDDIWGFEPGAEQLDEEDEYLLVENSIIRYDRISFNQVKRRLLECVASNPMSCCE